MEQITTKQKLKSYLEAIEGETKELMKLNYELHIYKKRIDKLVKEIRKELKNDKN